MDIDMDQETQQQLDSSMYSRIMVGAVAHLAEAIELALNLRDSKVIMEMETVCSSMFTQARAILDEQSNLQ